MKRIILLGIILVMLTGCTSVKSSSLQTIISEAINSGNKTKNVNRNGYRYYLPRGLSLKSSDNFNEVLTNQNNVFYLYVDVVSYNNKTEFTYNVNENAYYSAPLVNIDKKGYIEINNYKNNQYLIEIMYNYAKIEVIGYESDIQTIVAYAISVISSITYNDSVISNYLGNNVFNTVEESFNIFEIVGSDNYLQFSEDTESSDVIKDPDYVN